MSFRAVARWNNFVKKKFYHMNAPYNVMNVNYRQHSGGTYPPVKNTIFWGKALPRMCFGRPSANHRWNDLREAKIFSAAGTSSLNENKRDQLFERSRSPVLFHHFNDKLVTMDTSTW